MRNRLRFNKVPGSVAILATDSETPTWACAKGRNVLELMVLGEPEQFLTPVVYVPVFIHVGVHWGWHHVARREKVCQGPLT